MLVLHRSLERIKSPLGSRVTGARWMAALPCNWVENAGTALRTLDVRFVSTSGRATRRSQQAGFRSSPGGLARAAAESGPVRVVGGSRPSSRTVGHRSAYNARLRRTGWLG